MDSLAGIVLYEQHTGCMGGVWVGHGMGFFGVGETVECWLPDIVWIFQALQHSRLALYQWG